MNLDKLDSYEDKAVDTVTSVINLAKSRLGIRQSLVELTQTRINLLAQQTVHVPHLNNPIAVNGEKFIRDIIEKNWKLTKLLMYSLKYLETTRDEIADYYYYEAIFSQPTEKYPIPQATVSVFFRLIDKHLETLNPHAVLKVKFKLEHEHEEHDIRFVKLPSDWILGILQTKLNIFRKIEMMNLF